ncbi:small GTP binding protein RAB10 [Capsaspora owczarzaki ATCC 30864]|uniref:non-specific serine/threonine protein kinase n=1 Tax=Capsaspora owczarzaki (strain ATCC 30864) TaxID=595528 RepID=A0A0D2X145_CAPO3|nr:small GTP binding protein RAB10 [Capsaspora owczarzaki ATCC 30864]KJE90169.1 small GTP binding protein RAB10 [Capsaspora owczarzaki ATCC 30864]|eukprot:XP_004364382.1 small GTP binding protein RAB10 [Capsaspora owczarzaki ATCC 30864]
MASKTTSTDQPASPAQEANYDYLFKVLFVGLSGNGKSVLLARSHNGRYDSTIPSTIGVNYFTKYLTIDGKRIRLSSWDTAGQARYHSIANAYLRGAHGVVIAYDIAVETSFEEIKLWMDMTSKYAPPNVSKMIIGTKCDLEHLRAIDFATAKAFADEHNMSFLETSSKTNFNVENVFLTIATDIKRRIDLDRLNGVEELIDSDLSKPTMIQCDEVRVVLLGNPAVGKTSLVHGIGRHEQNPVLRFFSGSNTVKTTSTDGIDISTVLIRAQKEVMALNIWDFAGQELYLVSHQFFLGERTIYLVLFDVREPITRNSRLSFWLRSLHARVSGADVILVGTHTDDPMYTPELQQERRDQLANLLGFLKQSPEPLKVCATVYINARSAAVAPSMPELKSHIFAVGRKLPFYKKDVDERFLQFRFLLQNRANELQSKNEPPLLRLNQIFDLSKSVLNLKSSQVIGFLQLLRYQGWIVYHPTGQAADASSLHLSSAQHDIVILNPQWFTKTVLTGVITTKHKWVKKGIVARVDLISHIWKGLEADVCDRLLALLERYELLYPIQGSDDTSDLGDTSTNTIRFLVPSLLPVAAELAGWANRDANTEPLEAAVVMRSDFLPHGFFSRVIARLHSLKYDLTARQHCVLVSRNRHRALVRLVAHDREDVKELVLIARGTYPGNLLQVLVGVIDELTSRWYPGIAWRTYFRCSKCPEHGEEACLFELLPCVRDALLNKQDLNCEPTQLTLVREQWIPVLRPLLQYRLAGINPPTKLDTAALAMLNELQEVSTGQLEAVTNTMQGELTKTLTDAVAAKLEGVASDIKTAVVLAGQQALQEVAAKVAATGQKLVEESAIAGQRAVVEAQKDVTQAFQVGEQTLKGVAAQITINGEAQLQEAAARSVQVVQTAHRQILDATIQSVQDAVKIDPLELDRLVRTVIQQTQGDSSNAFERIEQLVTGLLPSRMDKIDSVLQEMRADIGRNWTRQVRMQLEFAEKPCPLLFVVVPAKKKHWSKSISKIWHKKFEAHLLCEHMSDDNKPDWHRIEGHEGYPIDKLSKWLEKYGPRVRALLAAVRPLLKLASIVTGGPDASEAIDAVDVALENPLEALPYLAKLLEEAGKVGPAAAASETTHSSQEAAREWVSFLTKKDEHQSFAGLERVVVMATGEVRWLCPAHAAAVQGPAVASPSSDSAASSGPTLSA